MSKKLRIGVVFGGKSGEHEVSLVSASSVISALDKSKYEVVQIGIAKDDKWFSGDKVLEALKAGKQPEGDGLSIKPGENGGGLNCDVVFPVLHGPFGEDGTIQGLFEIAGVPYVGAGVLGSSVGMDKIAQKDIVCKHGIRVAPYTWFTSKLYFANKNNLISKISEEIGFPCFVKPSNAGSSLGISKAHNEKELETALNDAVRYDRRIVVEQGIDRVQEIEVSVLGNEDPKASCAGEVIPSNEFYDYDAKYVDGKSKTLIPANLPKELEKVVRDAAVTAYRLLDIAGMARVDFLVEGDDVYFNEVNTIPGFTSISMYPKLWEASNMSYSKLLDELIRLAMGRFEEKRKLLTSYKPKSDWYKKS